MTIFDFSKFVFSACIKLSGNQRTYLYSGWSGLSTDIHFVDKELSYDVLSPLPIQYCTMSKHFNHPHPYIEIATTISDRVGLNVAPPPNFCPVPTPSQHGQVWCSMCVQSRGAGTAPAGPASAGPIIAISYCFFSSTHQAVKKMSVPEKFHPSKSYVFPVASSDRRVVG